MVFKTSKLHPPRIQGDSRVTELYRIISTDVLDGDAVHEAAVRNFLLVLRATTDYDVYIRQASTIHIPKEAPEPAQYLTHISYTLVGDVDEPLP